MAPGHCALHRRSDHGRIFRAWFPVSRLVGIVVEAARRHPAVVGGLDHAASAIRLVLPRRSLLDRTRARLYALSQPVDLADHSAARPQQSGGAGADAVAGGIELTGSAVTRPARWRSAW